MSDSSSSIQIKIGSTADLSALEAGRLALKGLQEAQEQAAAGLSTFGSAFGLGAGFSVATVAAMGLATAVRSVGEELKSLVTGGLNLAAAMENAQVGIAAALRTFDPERYTSFQTAMQASGGVIDALKAKSVQFGLSFPELAHQYTATVGAMFKGGITDIQKQIDLTITLNRAMQSFGVEGNRAAKDISDILNGVANRTVVGRGLGISDADVKAASEAGRLYEYLETKLAAFTVAVGESSENQTVLEARLRNTELAASESADAAAGLTEAYKGLLHVMIDLANSEAGKSVLQALAGAAAGATRGASALIGAISSPGNLTAGGDVAGFAALTLAATVAASKIASWAEAAVTSGGILKALGGATGAASIALGAFTVALGLLVLDLKLWHDAAEIKAATTEEQHAWDNRDKDSLASMLKGANSQSMVDRIGAEANRRGEAFESKGYKMSRDETGDPVEADRLLALGKQYREIADQAQRNGAAIVAQNKALVEQAALQDAALKRDNEAAALREALLKTGPGVDKAAEANRLALLKDQNPDAYVSELAAKEGSLAADREGPQGQASTYESPGAAPGDAEKAAGIFRKSIAEQIDAIEKEIFDTRRKQTEEADKESAIQAEIEATGRRNLTHEQQVGGALIDQMGEKGRLALLDAAGVDHSAERLKILEEQLKTMKDLIAAQHGADADALKAIEDQQAADQKKLSNDLADVSRDPTTTANQKWAQRTKLINDAIAAETAYKAKFDAIAADESQPADVRAKAKSDYDNSAAAAGADHDKGASFGPDPESFTANWADALDKFRNNWSITGKSLSDGFSGVMSSVEGGMARGIAGLINHTMTLKQAWFSVTGALLGSTVQMLSDMAAKWFLNHMILAAWDKLFAAGSVATHAAAETTKAGITVTGQAAQTGATAAGASARTGISLTETIIHGIHKGIQVAVHIGAEVMKTAATIAGAATRMATVLLESMASIIAAAAGAMAAMASIPYVGPFLAAAAAGTMIALGIGLVAKIGKGLKSGGYTGDGGEDQVTGYHHAGEYVLSAPAVRNLGVGNLNAMHEAAKSGFSSPASFGRSSSGGGKGGGDHHLYVVHDLSEAIQRAHRNPAVRKSILDITSGRVRPVT